MRLSDHRYSRDLRKLFLAHQLVLLGARMGIIVRWTQLSSYRIDTLNKGYGSGKDGPLNKLPQGQSPSTFNQFGHNSIVRRQTVTLACLLLTFRVIPPEPLSDAAENLPDLARGERLCRAYALFRSYVPITELSIDHAVFLAVQLA
jgi:hypothetical protein